jgi:hypothetical protein
MIKTKVSSNVEVDNVLELPMRKKIVSSREFAVKRKKWPGKARKPVRAPELHESSSSYKDETDPSNEYDGKLFAGRVVQKPSIAAAVEALDDDNDEDYADKKEAGDADEEQDDYATATTHKKTPLRCSKKQRRLHDKDVEDEDRNNRARSTTLSMQRKNSRRKKNGESTVVNLDVPICGMSESESRRNQQEYATQRIKAFVTSKVFLKIKFIGNDDMLQEAMDWVMNHDKVPQEKRLMYWVVFESVFNESLNAKRSTCETAGRKIVVDKTMPKFQEKGKELFTMEELYKLMRAETEREKEASFWFFGKFLSCVVGKRQWIVQKKYQLISQATMTGSSDKLVTISDETFALLMYENYEDKWTKQGNE